MRCANIGPKKPSDHPFHVELLFVICTTDAGYAQNLRFPPAGGGKF